MKNLIPKLQKQLAAAAFKPKTVQNYIAIIYRYCDYLKNQHQIDPVLAKPPHLQSWMVYQKTQVSNSRLTHHQAALSHFYGLLQKMGIRQDNPVHTLFPIRRQKSHKNQPITTTTALKLLRSIHRQSWQQERNFMIISLLWALGLRVREVTAIKIADFESNHDPHNRIGLLRIQGKGDKQRALFVVDKLYENLVHYLDHPQSPKHKIASMFPTHQNKTISPDRVNRMIKQTAHKAGITTRITPHVLRHSFATEMYTRGIPPDAIKALLGHSKMDETSIYIHVSEKLKKHALEQITINRRISCH